MAESIGLTMGGEGLFGLAIQQGSISEPSYPNWIDGGYNCHYDRMSYGYNEPITDELAMGSSEDYNDIVHWFPVTDMSFAPVKQTNVLPPETNRRALPTGIYLTGMWGEGVATIIPRLDDKAGWLLLATFGEASTIESSTASAVVREVLAEAYTSEYSDDGTSVGGTGCVNTHIFSLFDTHQFFAPWLTLYRLLPSIRDGEQVGEVYQDAHVRGFTMNVAAVSPVTIDLDMVGRVPMEDTMSYAFNVDPKWEDCADLGNFEDFAVTSCDGWVKVGGNEYDAVSLTMQVTNTTLDPADGITIGNYTPADFPILNRSVTMSVQFLIDSWDLYVSVFRGLMTDVSKLGEQAAGGDYSGDYDTGYSTGDMGLQGGVAGNVCGGNPDLENACTTHTGVTGVNPQCCILMEDFDLMLAAGICNVDDTCISRIRVLSNPAYENVAWSAEPVRLTPGRPVLMQATATFTSVGPAVDPFWVLLQNAKEDYVLPDLRA